MTDIFKSADWARDVERARAEAAKPDGIIGSDKGLEYTKALAAEALKGVWRGAPNGARLNFEGVVATVRDGDRVACGFMQSLPYIEVNDVRHFAGGHAGRSVWHEVEPQQERDKS